MMRNTIIITTISFIAALTVAILALVAGAQPGEVVGSFAGVFFGTMACIGFAIITKDMLGL